MSNWRHGTGYRPRSCACWRGEPMNFFRRLLLKLSRRRMLERDMEAELAFHREMAREYANPIGLGNLTHIQEEARDLWRFTFAEDLGRDVFYALRTLAKAPG